MKPEAGSPKPGGGVGGLLLILLLGTSPVVAGFAPELAYRAAEGLYSAGHFEASSRFCALALSWRPEHAAARALFMENEFILGRGREVFPDYGPYVSNLGTAP